MGGKAPTDHFRLHKSSILISLTQIAPMRYIQYTKFTFSITDFVLLTLICCTYFCIQHMVEIIIRLIFNCNLQ